VNSTTSLSGNPAQGHAAEGLLAAEYPSITKEYAGLVYGVALRCLGCPATAQEVTQDVFLLLSKKAGAVRPGHLSGWLHRTALLKSRERLRSENRYRRRLAEYARRHREADDSGSAEAAVESVLDHLDTAMDQLEDADRRILFLRYFEGLDAKAAGERLGISTEAAQKQCERARARLAGRLAATGLLTAGMLRAELAAFATPAAVAAGAAGLRGEPSAAAPVPGVTTFTRWLAGGGVAAAVLAGWLMFSSGPPAASSSVGRSAQPDIQQMPPATLMHATEATAANPAVRTAPQPDFAEIAALLERADEGDVSASAAAEMALAACSPAALLATAGTIREMPLPVNQLRVLALGIVRQLVSRDPKLAVLTGERLWRAQHGSSAPILASLVNEALARWHRSDPSAAAQWWISASAENILEDRGPETPETGGFAEHAFHQARQLANSARDTPARVALALRCLENGNSAAHPLPPWRVMADVLAHKLTAAQSAELADALDAHADMSDAAAFDFRLARALLPTSAPSLETLRRTATRAGAPDPDPEAAATVLAAWSQRDPAAVAAWLDSLRDTPDGAWIAALPPAFSIEDAPSSQPARSP